MPRGTTALGLRERKAATKRLALLDALLKRLSDRPLEQITVRELCAEVGVSEQTFFNTFGSKASVLVYFVMLWSIEMQALMKGASNARHALEALFAQSAQLQMRFPWVMPAVISEQFRARHQGLSVAPVPTLADKWIRFGEQDAEEAFEPFEKAEALPVGAMIGAQLSRAVEHGALSRHVDRELLERQLVSLFFGATSAVHDPAELPDVMVRGLVALWETAEGGGFDRGRNQGGHQGAAPPGRPS